MDWGSELSVLSRMLLPDAITQIGCSGFRVRGCDELMILMMWRCVFESVCIYYLQYVFLYGLCRIDIGPFQF